MKRTPLRPVSKKRAKVNRERAKMLEDHFGTRYGWRCWAKDRPIELAIMGPCAGPVNGHEILSRARAGRTDENLLDPSGILLLCNRHNGWCEDFPDEAHRLGLVKHAWEA